MTKEELVDQLKTRKVEAGLALCGLIMIVFGLLLRVNTSTAPWAKEGANEEKYVVDISGEVNNPGVYSMSIGSRVEDVVNEAGGMTEQADQEWVEKNLNKSQRLSDGKKIYIPTKSDGGEIAPDSSEAKMNINQASASELDKLPGIGEVTAEKIISERPYANIEELLERKIVSTKVFAEIKEKIAAW